MFMNSPVFDSVLSRDETIGLLQASVNTSAANVGATTCLAPLMETFTLTLFSGSRSRNRAAVLYITRKWAQ